MKKIIYTLLFAGALLVANLFSSNGTFQVTLESPTPPPTPTLIPLPVMESTPLDGPTQIPTLVPDDESSDPYGELYFTLSAPDLVSTPTPEGFPQAVSRLVRLPGSCVIGLIACPEPETLQTPFNVNDIFATDYSLMNWSPDGRYGVLVVHAEDELSRGRTQEELDQLQTQSPSEFNVNPSTLYMFDSQTNIWTVVYSAERKFFSSPHWSPDGQWIAFSIRSSVWGFHALQPDDGIYIVHPDGSALSQVNLLDGYVSGWIGNSILIQETKVPYPAYDYAIEMLTLDGEVKPLFNSSRLAFYALAPDGGSILVADGQGKDGGSPVKAVEVLALDGSVIYTFGTFTNYTSSIYPIAWAPDGSKVAFANLRRVYLGLRNADGTQPGLIGASPDAVRLVYEADDSNVQPSFWGLHFSKDGKYLLIMVDDGSLHFVTSVVDTGQSIPLSFPGVDKIEQPNQFSWRQ